MPRLLISYKDLDSKSGVFLKKKTISSSEQKQALKRYHAQVIEYKKTFTDEVGQKVLLDLMKAHGMLDCHFNVNDSDPYVLAFKEGQRNVILRILSIIKYDTKKLKSLIEERG